MGRLIYSMAVSLDGYVNDPAGSLDWVLIDEELHLAFNDEARAATTFVYGSRMWAEMAAYWPTGDEDPASTPATREFAAIWRSTPKLVVSRTPRELPWDARVLPPQEAIAEVARLRAEPGADLSVDGPTTAWPYLRAGLVDEVRTYVHPVLLGGGRPFFEPGGPRLDLRLLGERRFASGVVGLRYAGSGTR